MGRQAGIVKICGVTRPEDAEGAASAGADWIGLNFWAPSSRFLTPEKAHSVAEAVPKSCKKVGVFVNATVREILRAIREFGLDWVQLHGDETASFMSEVPSPAFKAIRAANLSDLNVLADYITPNQNIFLLDAKHPHLPGGTGLQVPSPISSAACTRGRCVLAGGLTPLNVEETILRMRPWGVDVAGGVESAPGIKDHDAMIAFVRAARAGFEEVDMNLRNAPERGR